MSKDLSVSILPKLLSWSVFLALMAYSPYMLDGALISKTLVLALMVLLSLLVAVRQVILNNSHIHLNTVHIYSLTFLALIWLSRLISTFYTINTSDAYFFLARDALMIVFLFLLFAVFKPSHDIFSYLKWPFIIYLIITLLIGFVQLIPWLFSGTFNAENSYGIRSLFAHRNMFAHMLILNLPLIFLGFRQRYGNALLFKGFFVISLIFISLLYCRTAWITFAISSLSISYFLYLKMPFDDFKTRYLRKNYGLIIALSLLTIGYIFFDFEELQKQIHNLTHWHYGSVRKRLELWSASFDLIKEHPFFGSGLASWKIEILRFISANPIAEGNTVFFQRPHNDFIWNLAESGLISLILSISFFIFVLRKVILSKSHQTSVAALFGIVSYLTMALLSFPYERTEHQIWLSVYVMLACQIDGEKERKLVSKKFVYLALLVAMLSLLVFAFRIKGEYYTAKAFEHSENEDYSQSAKAIHMAISPFYLLDGTSTPLSYHSGLSYLNLGMNKEAEVEFRRAVEINPYHLLVLNNYASTLLKNGKVALASEIYEKALLIRPDFNDALVNMALISAKQGKTEKALDLLRNVSLFELNDQHKEAIIAVLLFKLKTLQKTLDDDSIRYHLSRIMANRDWLYDIFEKSLLEKRTFENQIELDVKYLQSQT